MEQTEPPHRRSWWARRGVIAAFLMVGIGTATGAWFATRRTDDRRVQFMRIQPVQRPYVVGSDVTWLPDDAAVLGVQAGGRHRAYALSAFGGQDEHVVNDLVGGVPVTVAYCPRTNCAHVYTKPGGNWPLAVAVGGWVGESGPDGSMLLRVESSYYSQDTGGALEGWGHFPYPEMEFERTTWGAWRSAHPDTDVVAGPKREQTQGGTGKATEAGRDN